MERMNLPMIRQGVSFYSYQNAYREGRLDMEGMVAEVQKLGCDGVELVPIMTPPCSYPLATDREIEAWQALMEKYGTKPVCLDSIISVAPASGMQIPYAHPGAGFDEQVQLMRDELTLCNRLGFPIMRIPVGYGVRMDVIEHVLPTAEALGVNLGLEIHVPMTIRGEKVQNYLEFIARTGTKFASLIPDMAIFATALPTRLVRKTLREGGDPETVAAICAAYEAGTDMAAYGEELRAAGLRGTEQLLAFAERNVPSRVEELPEILPYISHFHAKFYDVDEAFTEHGIRFDRVVPLLQQAGWDGYLNSEFEGQRLYCEDETCDEIEQVRRQHEMVSRLLTGSVGHV